MRYLSNRRIIACQHCEGVDGVHAMLCHGCAHYDDTYDPQHTFCRHCRPVQLDRQFQDAQDGDNDDGDDLDHNTYIWDNTAPDCLLAQPSPTPTANEQIQSPPVSGVTTHSVPDIEAIADTVHDASVCIRCATGTQASATTSQPLLAPPQDTNRLDIRDARPMLAAQYEAGVVAMRDARVRHLFEQGMVIGLFFRRILCRRTFAAWFSMVSQALIQKQAGEMMLDAQNQQYRQNEDQMSEESEMKIVESVDSSPRVQQHNPHLRLLQIEHVDSVCHELLHKTHNAPT